MQYENPQTNPKSLEEALSQLIRSITIEEEALATLMRAEADKTLAFVGKDRELPTKPSNSEFIQFNQTVTKILDSILMAEWMLMKKIDSVMQFQYLVQSSALHVTQNENDLHADSLSDYEQELSKNNDQEIDF